MLAFRYLRPKKKEGFVSLIALFSFLGIALGVATLIIVLSVMNGFKDELLTRILGVNGHMNVYSSHDVIENPDSVAREIRAISGVRKASPIIESQVMISAHGVSFGALAQGLTSTNLATRSLLVANIVSGEIYTKDDSAGVIIGQRLARKLKVDIGNIVTLISTKTTSTAFGNLPRVKSFKITGIFNVGMHEYDSSFIYIPMNTAQNFFKFPNSASSVEIFLSNPNDVSRIRRDVIELLGNEFRVIGWQQKNSSFFNALQVERNVMFIILLLIILVAAFNIISSMTMLVKNKSKDIAILRTLGAKKPDILKIFFITGSTIGVTGTVLGFIFGILFCQNIVSIQRFVEKLVGNEVFSPEIYFLTHLPAKIDSTEVLMVTGISLLLSLSATLYPSWRASCLDPVESLRYE
jgi:lipoprotein-releasing system permease protein